MRQIEIPNLDVPWKWKNVEVEKIITDDGINRDAYKHIIESLERTKIIIQSVVLVCEGELYRVIAGKRRILAAKERSITKVHALVIEEGAPEYVLAMLTLIENGARRPNPGVEAESLAEVMRGYNLKTAKEIAHFLGISVDEVKKRLKLLKLVPKFMKSLKKGDIKLTLALKIASLSKKEQRLVAAQGGDLTVKSVAKRIKDSRTVAIPSDFFNMPDALPVDSNTEDRQLDDIINRVKSVINNTKNGRKAQLMEVLSKLEESRCL